MDRGDIYHVDLDPTKGKEQQGARYVLIVSPREFNRGGTSLVCPITQGGNYPRNKGFAVPLSGAGTNVQGVIRPGCPTVKPLPSIAGFLTKPRNCNSALEPKKAIKLLFG